MEDNQELNRVRWNDGQQHRSPTVDNPHEVRNLVNRQKTIETIISLLLIAAYGLIIVSSGLSLYFFCDAQITSNQKSGFLSEFCVLNNGESLYMCILAYVLQVLVAVCASILLLCSLVKSCLGVW